MTVFRNILYTAIIFGGVAVYIHNFYPNFDFHILLSKVPFFQLIGPVHSLFFSTTPKLQSENKAKGLKRPRLFTVEELKEYDGRSAKKGPYIAILGQVFNVKKGKAHYGPDGGYSFFAGKDGSRAFVSGDFTESGLTDDVTGLSSQDYIGLDDWLKFYHNDYKYVGKLIGRFYNEDGSPTKYNELVGLRTKDARSQKDSENKEKQIFPPCNSEWYPETGSTVYCTKKSGGIDRSWIGVPRQLYNPGRHGARCACVKNFGPPSHDPLRKNHKNLGDLEHSNLEEYKGCDPTSESCKVPNSARS